MTTLLPISSTKQEQAIESSIKRLVDLPVPLRDIWNPEKCPAELLPWLAWAFRVEFWKEGLPEDVKRDLIARAIPWHRKKGTLWAVRLALSDLGFQSECIEWWNFDGDPYTAILKVWVNDNFDISERTKNLILEAWNCTKSMRTHLVKLALGVWMLDQFELQKNVDSLNVSPYFSFSDGYPWPGIRHNGAIWYQDPARHNGIYRHDGVLGFGRQMPGSSKHDSNVDLLGTIVLRMSFHEKMKGHYKHTGSFRHDGIALHGETIAPIDSGGELMITVARRHDGKIHHNGGNVRRHNGFYRHNAVVNYSGGGNRYAVKEWNESL